MTKSRSGGGGRGLRTEQSSKIFWGDGSVLHNLCICLYTSNFTLKMGELLAWKLYLNKTGFKKNKSIPLEGRFILRTSV